jgi:shikimate kinase
VQGNIYLIGLMGAGKTTIGRKLATLLNLDFVDTDQVLEHRTGVSVSHIFEIEGERGFRERESKLFTDISAGTGQVVSTGGGLVLDRDNRKRMAASGQVVYLKATIDVLWHRLKDCKKRPLLQTENPREKVEELIATRDPVYSEVADHTIQVSSSSANRTAQRIAELLKGKNNSERQVQ